MPIWVMVALIIIAVLVVAKLVLSLSLVSVLSVTQGALFHPSASIRVKTFLDGVPMDKDDLLADLGCGDGRVLSAAHLRYGVRAVGFEINPLAFLMAKVRTWGIEGVTIRWKDFWGEDLGYADLVFCYLFPDVMGRLAVKLAAELRPGACVVSCNFPLPGWRPREVLHPVSSLHGDPIYLYDFPDALNTPEQRQHQPPVGDRKDITQALPRGRRYSSGG